MIKIIKLNGQTNWMDIEEKELKLIKDILTKYQTIKKRES